MISQTKVGAIAPTFRLSGYIFQTFGFSRNSIDSFSSGGTIFFHNLQRLL
jgi:ABC-type enterochelin transport system substrate-binding protein